MPRFFIEETPLETAVIDGEDGKHIARSLRMQPGEILTLCNGQGMDFLCEITEIHDTTVTVKICGTEPSRGEPHIVVTVYQGLPKSDKMDTIAQKAVEMGVCKLVPTMTARCVSRPDAKAAGKKVERWQKIADEAAKQCGRGKLPVVDSLLDFEEAVLQAEQDGEIILFYEGGGTSLRELVTKQTKKLSIFIGPEGGFSESEVAFAREHGARIGSLGTRILRTETAPIAALAGILFASGDM